MSHKDFPFYPVSVKARRNPVFGIGINDAWYTTHPLVGGKKLCCPIYRMWAHVLERVYSHAYHKVRPTYSHCSMDKSWHVFSVFREWVISQDWEGKVLDKDIIYPGNKLYSPDTCAFVEREINAILGGKKSSTNLPVGVHLKSEHGRYGAQINISGKNIYLGYFDTPEEAASEYNKAKHYCLIECAETQPKRIADGLIRHAELLLE